MEKQPIIEIKDYEGRFAKVIFAGIDITSCVSNVSYRPTTVYNKANFTVELDIRSVVDLLSETKDEDLRTAREIIRRHREIEG